MQTATQFDVHLLVALNSMMLLDDGLLGIVLVIGGKNQNKLVAN